MIGNKRIVNDNCSEVRHTILNIFFFRYLRFKFSLT